MSAGERDESSKEERRMKSLRIIFVLLALPVLSVLAIAQSLDDSGDSSGPDRDHSLYGAPGSYVHSSDTNDEAPQLLVRCFWAVSHGGCCDCGRHKPGDNTPPEWKQGVQRLQQAIWIRLWHRRDQHDDALWAGTSLQGRHAILPLRMQRRVASAAPCCDFYFDGSSRRRRPSRLFFSCVGCAVCRLDDGGLCVVSRPL